MLTAGTLFSVAIAVGFFLGEKGGLNSCGVYILFFLVIGRRKNVVVAEANQKPQLLVGITICQNQPTSRMSNYKFVATYHGNRVEDASRTIVVIVR